MNNLISNVLPFPKEQSFILDPDGDVEAKLAHLIKNESNKLLFENEDDRFRVMPYSNADSQDSTVGNNSFVGHQYSHLLYKTLLETLYSAASNTMTESTSPNAESRSETMDDNIMKYIDILDKDRRDMEKRLSDDKKDMEDRLSQERKDSEDRYNKAVDKLETRVGNLDDKFDRFSENVDNKLSEQRKFLISILVAVVGIIVALGIGFTQIILTILGKG